nr:unnamed protein product [Spirometra erinaceieuropaei]
MEKDLSNLIIEMEKLMKLPHYSPEMRKMVMSEVQKMTRKMANTTSVIVLASEKENSPSTDPITTETLSHLFNWIRALIKTLSLWRL